MLTLRIPLTRDVILVNVRRSIWLTLGWNLAILL